MIHTGTRLIESKNTASKRLESLREAGLQYAIGLSHLIDQTELIRADLSRRLSRDRRAELGQFFTPAATAEFMASLFELYHGGVTLLDAGAGVGALTAAFVAEMCSRDLRPSSIDVTTYEIEPTFREYLKATLESCKSICGEVGVGFSYEMRQVDFIEDAAASLGDRLFGGDLGRYTHVIMNPPYHKINSNSRTRKLLNCMGIETTNLYAAFMAIAVNVLEEGGELVAITPRSFCNGPYFRPFRKLFLEQMAIGRIHVFESRANAFKEDEVLQENVIMRAVKSPDRPLTVVVSASSGPEDDFAAVRDAPMDEIVQPGDPNLFIHVIPDELGQQVASRMKRLTASLAHLGISVSTGRVVDFRARESLRKNPSQDTVPLIYPGHLVNGFVEWPRSECRKPESLAITSSTTELLVPASTYVLVKRFSAKEESRRVVAAVYDPERVNSGMVGFENHLNYYHRNGYGLPSLLAKGLAVFLNSTLADLYFRLFNGHTQVNATDLRSLRYPTVEQLESLGARVGAVFPGQEDLDRIIEEVVFNVRGDDDELDPVIAKRRIDQAIDVLKQLGLPREQQNERSALTLLALLDLKPDMSWASASSPLIGITPMMEFFAANYGKRYAPNTRETVRRQTVHQFMDAGLVVANPDDPQRPINSPKAVYQVEPSVLQLLRSYGTAKWDHKLVSHLKVAESLRERYAMEREMQRIPLQLASGQVVPLSPGEHNVLVTKVINDFCPRFTPEAILIYVGDTDAKWAYFDREALEKLGVTVDEHGKMPDVVVYYTAKDWLVLVEAVTSHGPVNPKRRNELKELFARSTAGLVFVTAFMNRSAMLKYLNDISWETEVWVADAPTHLIHFNGERFLGPY